MNEQHVICVWQPPSDHNVLRDGGHAAHDDPTYEGDSGAELRVEEGEGGGSQRGYMVPSLRTGTGVSRSY